MNPADRELAVRLDAVNSRFRGFPPVVDEAARRLMEAGEAGEPLSSDDLRAVGLEFVSLGGELTKLGVDMAVRAGAMDAESDRQHDGR